MCKLRARDAAFADDPADGSSGRVLTSESRDASGVAAEAGGVDGDFDFPLRGSAARRLEKYGVREI